MSVGRNEPCPCGSGKKFKHCCQDKAASSLARPPNAPVPPDPRRLDALKRAARELFSAEKFFEAIAPLKEAARLSPNSADAHYDLAVARVRCGRFPEAAKSLRRALTLRPAFHEASAQLAQVFEYLMENAKAAAIHRRLSRAAPDPRRKLRHIAKALMLEGRPAEAETTLRRLTGLDPGDGWARSLLGSVLIDQRRFDEAAVELRLALETVPAAFHKLASARRVTAADRPLLDRMSAKADEAGIGAEDRTLILYGLGKAHDDLGEFDTAMANYDAANALRRKAARFDRAALARRYDKIIARYNAEGLHRLVRDSERAGAGMNDERPLLIVGLPRSGTTLVEQILSSHPQVTAGGELQFWRMRSLEMEGEFDAWRDPAVLKRAAADYGMLLTRIGPDAQRITDKAPLNFEALGLVLSALPRARVIHCRRTPIDTALSIYFTEFSSSLGFAFDRGDIVQTWRQYSRLMTHWREVLSPYSVLEVDYEDLVADPEPAIRRMIAFAGLPWDEACLAPERNDRVVKTASLWQVRQPIYGTSVERWRRYQPWLGELAELVSEDLADSGLTVHRNMQ